MKTIAIRVWDTAYLCVLGLVFLASIGLTIVVIKRHKPLIRSDGKYYYIWARSILLDGDIDFRDDYSIVHDSAELPPESAVRTPRGYVVNKYPIGMAILETPGLLIGDFVARHVARAPTDGWSPPYQVAVVWSLFALYFASFVLLYRAMLYLGAGRIWAFCFSLMSLLGTNLIHYVARDPTMAHAAGVAVFNILLFLAARWAGRDRPIRVGDGVLLGILIGLFFLIRNTNVLLVPVLAVIIWTRRRAPFGEVVPMVVGAAATAVLQPVSLWFLWGRLRFSTYYNEYFTSGIAGILHALVSVRNGLLVYSPWYAVLLLIVAYGALRVPQARRICVAAIASFLLMLLANGTWYCWWFGSSFGGRAFIETLPLLSLAAAVSVSWLRIGRRASVALLAAMLAVGVVNLYLWMGYLLQVCACDGSQTAVQAYLWLLSHSPASLIQRLAH